MKAISNILNIFKGNQDEEYDDEEYDDTMELDDEQYTSSNDYSNKSKVVPMSSAISSAKMVITQPTCYKEVEELGDYLRNKKAVIINLENVTKEEGQRILDFMGGAVFMVEGTIQKVSNLIYLATPRCVEIQNEIEKKELSKKQMDFSWMK